MRSFKRAGLVAAFVVAFLIGFTGCGFRTYAATPKVDPRCQCVPQVGTGTPGPGWRRNAIGGGQSYGRHGR
jgi:hypothetical protein